MDDARDSSTTGPAVLTEQIGDVFLVTINRPEAMNAVNAEVATLIGEALESADNESSIRAIVLTGSGDRSFCAGVDLKAVARGEDTGPRPDPGWGFAGYVRHFVSKPTIAAVNGFALGGGTELCLASDLVVAAESARFGLPEVKRGIIAGAGGAFRLPRALPRKVAMELLLTGESISAAEALRWGLVNRVVPRAQVVGAALELAAAITVNAPLSVQASKRLAYRASLEEEEVDWQRSAIEGRRVVMSEDGREGPRAFAEKRVPVWKGR
jgi:crotonobetainyl-CoA hydratase